jgi:hypothetical protein
VVGRRRGSDRRQPSEPLIGYIVLAQAQAAVDFVVHRLVKGRPYDLERIAA